MEKAYKNLSFFFAGIFIIILFGFFNSYFSLFPQYGKLPNIVHFHALTLVLWSLLLIIQPLLIRFKKQKTHKLLGKFSYMLAPLIIFSMLAMTRKTFTERTPDTSDFQALSGMFISLSHTFLFGLFYVLAMIKTGKPKLHMRFIILASLTGLAPAIARINIAELGITMGPLLFSFVFTDLVIAALIIFDLIKKSAYKPYVAGLILFVLVHFSTYTFAKSDTWIYISGNFTRIFF